MKALLYSRVGELDGSGDYQKLTYSFRQTHRYLRLLQGTERFPDGIDKVCANPHVHNLSYVTNRGAIGHRFGLATPVRIRDEQVASRAAKTLESVQAQRRRCGGRDIDSTIY